MDKFRATGRTTRLLEHALALAVQGKEAIIYTHLRPHTLDLMSRVMEMGRSQGISIDVLGTYRTDTRVTVGPHRGIISIKAIGRDFNWVDLRDRGILPATIVLVDHYALERMYPAVTQMLYRFMAGPSLTEEGHRHRWQTRYVTIEGVECASGMACECGVYMHQHDVEAAVNYWAT